MAKRPDLPSPRSRSARATPPAHSTAQKKGSSGSPRSSRGSGAAQRVDVRDWLGGVRLSVFMMIMFGLVIFAVFMLVPTVGTYIGQVQRIDALEHSVQVAQDKVDALEAERDRWNDPNYVITQARERLFYYRPGEVVYLVVDDLDPAALPGEQKPVSDTVEQAPNDWMGAMLRSVTEAGLTQSVAEQPADAPTDAPTDGATPAG
ncbi:MAG: septum formation initiator family protein [Microbacterium sp.]|nr:septum formation initiator family protein [Microbacterium sp.]